MADAPEVTPEVTFKVKTSGDKTHTITMSESATVAELKTKLGGEEYENIPIERQRLIYSGRVMKNEEPLSTYRIKAGNTVHLVKSAASNPAPAPPASSSTPAAPQVPTNMAAGTANNPLAGLTGMSGSMMDEDQMARLLSNPNVAQQMNEALNNDTFLDMMIQSHPMLRNNPNAREILRSPMMRQMMTNPDAMRSAARFSRMMRGPGGSQNAFPAPGVTDTTPGDTNAENARSDNQQGSAPPNLFDPSIWGNMQIPGGATGGAGATGANPFGAVFNPFAGAAQGAPGAGATTQATPGARTDSSNPQSNAGTAQGPNASGAPLNPFASLFGAAPGGVGGNPYGNMPPEALQQLMQMMGMNSPSGSPAPADNRPPEERYAEQLRQLNDMGFYDFDRNVAALRRSGGSVQGAIEHLLSGP
ncbi:uncharacterized protein BCR38DRAFT_134979 [Pseudomassariella vexata]|uniref:Uncharacterized protein n=1 Tax=Pseudomassariella vexata TaxID=1141098 RepID=A0A1Y2EAI3_9PEZI|nr:uncharacterized protein BCR38DRAFT_134979 [Pseudomassariella vexata]ORY68598.1 hypothetical protein BCR38DRAFT_134979 [Pseudomassariella vexata]